MSHLFWATVRMLTKHKVSHPSLTGPVKAIGLGLGACLSLGLGLAVTLHWWGETLNYNLLSYRWLRLIPVMQKTKPIFISFGAILLFIRECNINENAI